MEVDGSLMQLVALLYDTLFDARTWSEVLSGLCTLLNADSSLVLVLDEKASGNKFCKVANLDVKTVADYRDQYWSIDPWYRYAVEKALGKALLTQNITGDEQLLATVFYNDFLKPLNIHYAVGSVIHHADGLSIIAAAHRPRAKGPMGEEEFALFNALLPHMQRIVRIRQALLNKDLQSVAALEALDNLHCGLIFVGAEGEVVHLNRAASDLAALNDGLAIRAGRVCAAATEDTATLRAMIARATAEADGTTGRTDCTLPLRRPSLLRPLRATVVPLRVRRFDELGLSGAAGTRSVAMLIVSDPERQQTSLANTLRRLYGLTAAQARLAEALANQKRLSEAAEELGISRETAKSHLRQIFLKTETSRQSELIRLILSDPMVLS